MDNRTSLVIAALILAVFAADALYFDWGLPVYFGKLLARITEWLAFWR